MYVNRIVKTVFEDASNLLRFEVEASSITWVCIKPIDKVSFHTMVEKAARVFKLINLEQGVKNFIVDCRHLGRRDLQDLAWVAFQVVPCLINNGLQTVAFVAPHDLEGDALLDNLVAMISDLPLKVLLFSSIDLARSCLQGNYCQTSTSMWS